MKILTKALVARFEQVGRQGDNPIIIAKFFNPQGAGTWYATELDPAEGLFYGYISILGDHNDEWGYFSLEVLESYVGRLGLGIERDLYWKEKRFSEVFDGKLLRT